MATNKAFARGNRSGENIASVHRFHESVAARLGDGSTTYLTAMQARYFAEALLLAAASCESESFVFSNVGTISVPVEKVEE